MTTVREKKLLAWLILQAGYAVIFLNRRHSIQPFTKGLPSGEIMDTLTNVLDCNGGSSLKVKDNASDIVRQAVAKAKQVLPFQAFTLLLSCQIWLMAHNEHGPNYPVFVIHILIARHT